MLTAIHVAGYIFECFSCTPLQPVTCSPNPFCISHTPTIFFNSVNPEKIDFHFHYVQFFIHVVDFSFSCYSKKQCVCDCVCDQHILAGKKLSVRRLALGNQLL